MQAFQEQQQKGEDYFHGSVVFQMLASGIHSRKWEGEASLGLNPVLDQRVEVVCWRSSPTLKFRSQTYTCKEAVDRDCLLGCLWSSLVSKCKEREGHSNKDSLAHRIFLDWGRGKHPSNTNMVW